MALSPMDIAKKWASNLASAAESAKKGAMSVQEAPTMKAAAKLDKAKTRYNEAIENGSMKQALEATTLEDWRRPYLSVGISRMQTGARENEGKMMNFMTQWMPHAENTSRTIANMPDTTIEDAAARAAEAVRLNAKFKYRKRG